MAKNYAKMAAAKQTAATQKPAQAAAPAPATEKKPPAQAAAAESATPSGMQRGWKLILSAITTNPNQNLVAFVKLIEDWLVGLRPELQQALLQRWTSAMSKGSAVSATVNPNPPPQAAGAPPGPSAGTQGPATPSQRPAQAA